MIYTIRDLMQAIGKLPCAVTAESEVRVYLNGNYVIEHVWQDPGGKIMLWLDERGDPGAE